MKKPVPLTEKISMGVSLDDLGAATNVIIIIKKKQYLSILSRSFENRNKKDFKIEGWDSEERAIIFHDMSKSLKEIIIATE